MKDINLQEAVRRREEQLPPMPSDLNERLMNSLTPHPSPRRVELKRLLLVAASLVLVVGIGFKFLRLPKQTETKVVQVVEREEQPAKQPVVEPSQPVVAEAEEPLQQKPSLPSLLRRRLWRFSSSCPTLILPWKPRFRTSVREVSASAKK